MAKTTDTFRQSFWRMPHSMPRRWKMWTWHQIRICKAVRGHPHYVQTDIGSPSDKQVWPDGNRERTTSSFLTQFRRNTTPHHSTPRLDWCGVLTAHNFLLCVWVSSCRRKEKFAWKGAGWSSTPTLQSDAKMCEVSSLAAPPVVPQWDRPIRPGTKQNIINFPPYEHGPLTVQSRRAAGFIQDFVGRSESVIMCHW
jgi:hypothetical protein